MICWSSIGTEAFKVTFADFAGSRDLDDSSGADHAQQWRKGEGGKQPAGSTAR
jgi:hypothetical protein